MLYLIWICVFVTITKGFRIIYFVIINHYSLRSLFTFENWKCFRNLALQKIKEKEIKKNYFKKKYIGTCSNEWSDRIEGFRMVEHRMMQHSTDSQSNYIQHIYYLLSYIASMIRLLYETHFRIYSKFHTQKNIIITVICNNEQLFSYLSKGQFSRKREFSDKKIAWLTLNSLMKWYLYLLLIMFVIIITICYWM